MLERFTIWLAWKMPRTLAYWCTARVIAHATTGQYSSDTSPEVTVVQALDRW